MGKSKKDRKGKRAGDSDSGDDDISIDIKKSTTAVANDDMDVVADGDGQSSGAQNNSNKQAKKKKKGKNKRGNDDDDEEEFDHLDILATVKDKDDLNDIQVKKVPMKKKPPAKKMGAFQMLEVSDSDDRDSVHDGSGNSEEESKPVQKSKKAKKGKPVKSVTGSNDADDDDVDLAMASIDAAEHDDTQSKHQAPAKKKEKKKKKQKADKKEEEDDIDAILASIAYTDDPSGVAVNDEVSDLVSDMQAATLDNENDADGEKSFLKSKAQKKKDKREKEKLKKKELKSKGGIQTVSETQNTTKDMDTKDNVVSAETVEVKEPSPVGDEKGGEETSVKKKDKKKKKTKEEKEEEEKAKKKPGKGKIKAMQEALAALKEAEEKRKREEEEADRRAEEKRLAKEEAERIEKEKKDKLKLKKKEREQRLKDEGKWLTDKQKQDRRRAIQMLEMMKQQGIEVPSLDRQEPGEKKKRVVYEKKKKRPQQQKGAENDSTTPVESPAITPSEAPVLDFGTERPTVDDITEDVADEVVEEDEEPEEPKDEWDADSDAETDDKSDVISAVDKAVTSAVAAEEDEEDEEEEPENEESEDEDSSEEDSSSESSEEDSVAPPETVRQRAMARILKRQEENEKNRSTDVLRSPVVCVLGHVDTGKTKILDKLRRTHVQDGEAGGITQQIGATNVPVVAIKEQTKMCKDFAKLELKLPGLLIIDTPGHESFSNLRSRGSSLCDIAVLVVDIMHGLEPQTLESIERLKKRRTPFIVALNKIDRLFQWKTNPHADVFNTIKKQQKNTKDEFDDRVKNIVLEFAQQSLNVTLFYENKNPKEWVSMVPTSAHSGDGMGNLMALICELTQTMLAKRLSYSAELQATVMEVKALPGLGTTIDVCLVNGALREGETIIVAGQEGPIVTQIRGLLIPPPMKELRVKNQYEKVKVLRAAHGVKIIAKDLEKALAGLPLYACFHPDEVDIVKEEVAAQLKSALNSIKLSERGVFVQASTLGSLEALLEFLKSSKIPYAGINIGPVHKKDVMRASVMLEHDIMYACILAFDVKVERDAQEMADNLGVRVFTADIIYHLFDRFMEFRETYKMKKKDEFRHIAVFPVKLRILPQFIFNSRDPIVIGVSVEGGVLRQGTPICVPSKDFVELGRISSLEINNKPIESARKGQDVCVKIDPVPGEAPKMFGRHFEAEDMLVSSISRESIDALKDYFREDMQKTDWQLMIDLKKMFKIS